jgi:K+-transporting ATPase ATPase C chain
MSTSRGTLRQYSVALRLLLVFTVVLGIGYPALVGLLGRTMPARADGSLVSLHGQVVGSTLIGQSFTDADGNPLPEWFQSRPSAAGYDGAGSVGSNLGPESADLVQSVEDQRAAIAAFDGVDAASVPADALTSSASGLDPDISPDYALLQVHRVAEARGLAEGDVKALVESMMDPGTLGYLSYPTVNVLKLNVALAALK